MKKSRISETLLNLLATQQKCLLDGIREAIRHRNVIRVLYCAVFLLFIVSMTRTFLKIWKFGGTTTSVKVMTDTDDGFAKETNN